MSCVTGYFLTSFFLCSGISREKEQNKNYFTKKKFLKSLFFLKLRHSNVEMHLISLFLHFQEFRWLVQEVVGLCLWLLSKSMLLLLSNKRLLIYRCATYLIIVWKSFSFDIDLSNSLMPALVGPYIYYILWNVNCAFAYCISYDQSGIARLL